MVDDEIELRPILCCFRQVLDSRVFPATARDRGFIISWHQSFVNADRIDACLRRPFVEWVDKSLVIEPPWVLGRLRVKRVADCVTLPAGGLDLGDAAINLFHPARLLRGKQGMEQQSV